MLSIAIPAKNTIIDNGCSLLGLFALNNKYPATKFTNAHITLVVEEERPMPRGFEKGVGNLLPEIPCTK